MALLAVSMVAYSGIGDGKVCGLKGISVEAAEIVESGSCGENATYTLDSDGMMIISGTGSIVTSNFHNNEWIKRVVIREGVTGIGYDVFYRCSSLTSIEIPSSVTEIGWAAFYGCSSLKDISIPASVTYLDEEAFAGCSGLEEINIEYENPSYCSENGVVFDKTMSTLLICPEGKSGDYVIPVSVTHIDGRAFGWCRKLTSIEISGSVTTITSDAFTYCSSLTSIEIPDSVTEIRWGTFDGCESLTGIEIPLGVTSIGDAAFQNCSSLTSVNIPSGVTYIGDYAFNKCRSLKSIEIPSGLTSIGDAAFQNCSSLTSVNIPSGVTCIGDYAFYYCISLTDIEIPENTTSIGVKAFGYTYDEESNRYIGLQNFTIYGSTGTEAERYANDNGFTFVPFVTQLSSEDNITLEGEKTARIASDMTLDTKEITEDSIGTEIDKRQLEQCITTTVQEITLDSGENINYKAYDIRLLDKDQQPVQPKEKVTVRIPVPVGFNAENCHVYRLESDNTFKDMRASCSEDTLTFKTDHFSVYVITEQMLSITPSQALGDVNDDEAVDIADALLIARYDAGLIELEDAQLACSDVNGDSDTDIADALLIARYDAGLIGSLE